MKGIALLALALSTASGAVLAAQQLYRWVDEKGTVEWRDTPPPPHAKQVEIRRVGGSMIQTSTLPYSVQQAVNNFPVTLWVFNCGVPCDQARAHLARRGVPHTEKDPQADRENFEKLTGSAEVPVLVVGSNRIKGYLESEWDSALDIAGYPRTPPPGLMKPAAKPAPAPAPKPAQAGTPPVTLYTHPECGAPCVEAKDLLASRGVAFREVLVQGQSAIDELHKLSGDTRVPVLAIGENVTRGFYAPGYHEALDAAGFTRQRTVRP